MKGLIHFRKLNCVSYMMEKNKQTFVTRIILSSISNNIDKFCHTNAGLRPKNYRKIVRKYKDINVSVLSHSTVKDLLQKCESVPEQIEVFQSYVKLTNEDISKRFHLCNKIESIFKSVFPQSSVHLIGSSATSLGRKGCDVDLTFQLLNNDQALQNNSNINLTSDKDGDVGEVTPSKFLSFSTKLQLLFLKEQLMKSDIGGNFTIIPGRCPILNFTCNDLVCDLSINNWSALHATNLMRLCEKLDYRVAPLFHLIVYWGKHSKIIGGLFKFKSYSIFLLLVYFLQTRHHPILPTVKDIFHKTEILKNGSDCLYDASQCVRKFQPSENSESLENLLREFFFFYGNFDFSSVICVLNADLFDGKTFKLQQPNFVINTISIQDPFDLSRNVTTDVSWKYTTEFLKSLLSKCEAYHENYFKTNKDENWGLTAVLDSSFQKSSFLSNGCVEIQISLKNALISDNNIEKCWNIASGKIYRLLREGLIFQCTNLEYGSNAAQLSINYLSHNVHSEYSNKDCIISCSTESDADSDINYSHISSARYIARGTWLGRSNHLQNFYAEEMTFLDNEHNISHKILKNKSAEDKKEFSFLCECIGVHRNSNAYLIVKLKPVDQDTFLSKIGIVLKEYILKYALRYL